MDKEKIKFGIVGIGSIGKRHIAVLDADENCEIVAICDIDEEKCKEQSLLYDLKYYQDYDKMLDEIDADVINVVTPHAMHAEMSVKALNKGFHVLVEKPMALHSRDCASMVDAAKANNRKLWVVKQNRYNVPIRLAKEAMDQEKLGKIFMIKCDILWNRYQGYYDDSPWRGSIENEGGALFTQASHFIDLLVWWCGSVQKVRGYMETQNHNIETEDSGAAIINFESGTIGSLVWTTCVYNKNYEGSITIIGEKGTIKIGGKYLNKIEYWDVEGHPLQEGIEYSDQPNSYGKYQGTSSNHDKVIKALVNHLRTDKDDIVQGVEGMRSIDAIEKIYSSIRNA